MESANNAANEKMINEILTLWYEEIINSYRWGKSDSVPIKELDYVIKSTGIELTPADMKQLKQQLNPDNKASIPKDAVVDYLVNLLSGYNEDLLLNALKRLDGNSDGIISLDELEYYLKTYGIEQDSKDLKLLLSCVPVDKSKNIDIKKMAKAFTKVVK